MACDEEILPLLERNKAIGDDANLTDAYDIERH